LFCHIQRDELKQPTKERGKKQARTLQTLKDNHQLFINTHKGDTKKAKLCKNVISPTLFNVPINQVNNFPVVIIDFFIEVTRNKLKCSS